VQVGGGWWWRGRRLEEKVNCEQSFLPCHAFIAVGRGGRRKVVATSFFLFFLAASHCEWCVFRFFLCSGS